MFAEFERPAGNIFHSRVNSWLGCVFLGVCALWAAMFVSNVTSGSNPVSAAIVSAIAPQTSLQ